MSDKRVNQQLERLVAEEFFCIDNLENGEYLFSNGRKQYCLAPNGDLIFSNPYGDSRVMDDNEELDDGEPLEDDYDDEC